MIKEDGQVIHFNNPKVQASLAANTFAVTGHAETKRMFWFHLSLDLKHANTEYVIAKRWMKV